MNPILTGHVYGKQNTLWVQSGTFTPDNHDFVKIVEPPRHLLPDLDSMSDPEILQFVTENVLKLMGDDNELTSDQTRKKLPLFGASLVILDDKYAIFSIKASHAVGDGTTYFQLVKQVSLHMSGLPVPPIDWNCPAKPSHEIYPPNMSKRDVFNFYGPPFMLGCTKNILTQKREPQFILLDKHKVTAVTRAMRAELGSKDISTNDVITSALCQSNPGADVFCFTESVRGVEGTNVPKSAGGNFFWEIPVPRSVCSEPDRLRKVTASHQSGYDTNKLPLKPFLCGRHARITSLASVTKNVVYDGVDTVAVVPFCSSLKAIPLDIAMIFRFNRECWGILHNFAEFEPSELFQQLQL